MDDVTIACGVIKVTKRYMSALPTLTDENYIELQNEYAGETICPATFTFNDTPTIRKILEIKE